MWRCDNMDSEGELNKVILGRQCPFNLKDNSRRFSCFPDLRNYFFLPTICLGINCLNLRNYIAALKSLRVSVCQLRCVYEDPWYCPAEICQRLTYRDVTHLHRHSTAYYCTFKVPFFIIVSILLDTQECESIFM